jgi:hypothetical protein
VRAILPVHVAQVHEPQVDLVDERGGLQVWSCRSPFMWTRASRRSSDCTADIRRSSAPVSPAIHSCRRTVTRA